MSYDFFATAPRGAEDLLVTELIALGVEAPKQRLGGVAFAGPLELGYRACLWSRIASRVLLTIAQIPAFDGDALYEGAKAIAWEHHLAPGATFAIAAAGRAALGSGIDNTHFAALRVKDGLVDQLREHRGERPNVELDAPDLRLRLHLAGERATLSVDLAGEGLHRRGYRVASVAAPLRENLAAAVLMRAGWTGREPACVDPMCGSGTLLIEAAWIAADIAPGLLRERFGLVGWAGHDPALWAKLEAEAEDRRTAGLAAKLPRLIGYDAEPEAVRAALACVDAAGLHKLVHIEKRSLATVEAPQLDQTKPSPERVPGLVVCNPPWGERLGTHRELESLYAALGRQLRERFPAWNAAILTGEPSLGLALGIRAKRRNVLHDGPIECQILRLELDADPSAAAVNLRPESPPRERSEGARSFANRLSKNRKKLKAYLRREQVSCYRLYDADIPEYNLAVDLYESADTRLVHAHVQEYAPPKTVDEVAARRRRIEALAVIREDLDLPRERVHLKRRERQKGRKQYEKLDDSGHEFVVAEGPARFWVNLDDYIDTGLFLDHRPIRRTLRELAAGKQFLNLFAYTGAATVHAAHGRATSTTTVDMSRTYLEWAGRNLALNGFSSEGLDGPPRRGRIAHELVQADVLEWLREQGSRRWDLIFCDPPSFSNSKRMQRTLDVQRDHVELIRRCVALLRPDGVLVFSTNLRKFALDQDELAGLEVVQMSGTVPPDFGRNRGIHHVWLIRRR